MNDFFPTPWAIRLLESLIPDCEALAGDLLEEVAHGRSHLWLWQQVFAAVLVQWVGRRAHAEIRPLRLVECQPLDAIERSQRWSSRLPVANLSGSPIAGVGGLGLLMMGLLISVTAPAIWFGVVVVMVAGSVIGAARAIAQRVEPRAEFPCSIRVTP